MTDFNLSIHSPTFLPPTVLPSPKTITTSPVTNVATQALKTEPAEVQHAPVGSISLPNPPAAAKVEHVAKNSLTFAQGVTEENPSTHAAHFQNTSPALPLPQLSEIIIKQRLEKTLPYELRNDIDKIVKLYKGLSEDPSTFLNGNAFATSSSVYFSKKTINQLDRSVIKGPEGHLYAIVPKGADKSNVLGAGTSSVYTGLVDLHELGPASLGRMRHETLKDGKEALPAQDQIKEIENELIFRDKLFKAQKPGEHFPFLLPIARVEHISEKGVIKSGRLCEYAPGNVAGAIREADLFNPQGTAQEKKETLLLVRDLLRALKMMDENHIVHRDLKGDNLMFVRDEEGLMRIKIADWGYATDVEQGRSGEYTSKGTPEYLSFNILRELSEGTDIDENTRKELGINHGNDVWAAGVILYEVLTRQMPQYILDADHDSEGNQHNDPMMFISNLALLSLDDIQNSFPPAPKNSLLGLVLSMFSDHPPSASTLLKQFDRMIPDIDEFIAQGKEII